MSRGLELVVGRCELTLRQGNPSNSVTASSRLMSRTIDVLNPQKPKRIALVASNAAVSKQTGWPIGFWWSELSHPYWFYDNDHVQDLAARFYQAGKITAVLCHATCLLLKVKLEGKLLVEGKTWTGFANSEEQYADEFVGKRIQPFRIED